MEAQAEFDTDTLENDIVDDAWLEAYQIALADEDAATPDEDFDISWDESYQVALADDYQNPYDRLNTDLDRVISQQKESHPTNNLNAQDARSGFDTPSHQNFGAIGKVLSVPQNLNLSTQNFEINDDSEHRDDLSKSFATTPSVSIIDDAPPIMPPNITPTPSISINDCTLDEHDVSIFTISLLSAQSEAITVGFSYPNDVKVVGGTGLTSHASDAHQGILTIPAGSTSVTLAFELLLTSTLEPGDQFEITLYDDLLGTSPTFIKDVGVATIPTDDITSMSATHDIFWTALQETQNYSVSFVIDLSGSMNKGIEEGDSRLEKAKRALVEFIDLYDNAAENVIINIIPFGSGDNNQGAFVYTATSVEDAKDFVLKQGPHAEDGLAIGMINPNTGEALDRGTQYNDALYHARLLLESNIIDPSQADFAQKLYFFSDGRPNPNHGAYDNQNWPTSWSDWPTFIADPKSEISNSFADQIDTFAVSLGLNPAIASALQAIVLSPDRVFAVDDDLSNLNDMLLTTVPAYFQGELLSNDASNLINTKVVEIGFAVNDAQNYIATHHLDAIGAKSTASNDMVYVPIPSHDNIIKMPTPLGGTLLINNAGEFFYHAPQVESDSVENFQYQIRDMQTQAFDQSTFSINIIANPNEFHQLQGDENDSTLSTSGLSGVVTMLGHGGDNTFTIDLQSTLPHTIVIHDLFNSSENHLSFHTGDNTLSLSDIFTDVQQAGPHASISLTLDYHGNTAKLYLDDPGISVLNLNDTLSYLEDNVLIDFF